MRVLLSSVGRRVELVRAFRASFRRMGITGGVVGTDVDWLAPGLQVVDIPRLVPRCHDEDFVPALLRICEAEGVKLLLPLIDPEIPILARHRAAFADRDVELGVISHDAAEVTFDKWRTSQFFTQLGLPTPKTWLPEPPYMEEIGRLPTDCELFVKPRFGSASAETHRVRSKEELKFHLPRVSRPVVQEFIAGPEITTDVICDFRGRFLTAISRRRITTRGGEAQKAVTEHHPRIVADCQRIAAALPAQGPFTVQCILQEAIPWYIEINARLGGGVPLAIAAGIDVPRILVSLALRRPVDASDIATPREGLYMTRCDESFFVGESFRVALEGDRI